MPKKYPGTLSKTRSVLDLLSVDADSVTYGRGGDYADVSEHYRDRKVILDSQTYEDMGKPERITLTVEPGDVLTPEVEKHRASGGIIEADHEKREMTLVGLDTPDEAPGLEAAVKAHGGFIKPDPENPIKGTVDLTECILDGDMICKRVNDEAHMKAVHLDPLGR